MASSAPKDTTRCAQAECIASRHELELVQRDLAELERETDQLHEQLAAKESECSTLTLKLQQHEADAQRQLSVRDAQIADLRRQLDASSKQKPTDNASTTKPAAGEAATNPDAEIASLRAANASLEAALAQLRASMARESAASAGAQQQVDQLQKSVKGKRDELYEALKENELLRRERQEREDALEKVSQLALDYETALRGLHAQQGEWASAIDELREDNTQLRTKIDQLEREKEHVETQLLALDAHERDVDTVAAELVSQHAVDKAVLIAELEELRKQLDAQKKMTTSKNTTQTKNSEKRSTVGDKEEMLVELERQLELVHDLRVEGQLKLEAKEEEIQQLKSDIESLVLHLHETADVVSSSSSANVSREGEKKLFEAKEENAALRRRLHEQQSLVHSLEFRQSQLEERLTEAEAWNAKYEANAGLEDVVKHQKKLRRALEAQQLANQTLRQQLNDQREAAGKLRLAFERMRAEAGRPEDFEYTDLEVAEELRGELAVQQAVARQLEEHVEELEKERVKLLQQLRRQARVVGGKLFEAHGLTVEQWGTVEEFMEAVRLTPEMAKRWSKGLSAEYDTKKHAGEGGRGEEEALLLERLSEENARLRGELAAATAAQLVREAVGEPQPSVKTTEKETEGKETLERKHAATSPLKAAPQTTAPSSPVRDSTSKGSTAAQATELQQAITSPEALAQAIAAALDARLALLQQQPLRTSVATQPSLAKPTSVSSTVSTAEGDALALASDAQLQQQVDFLLEFQLLLDAHAKLGAEHQGVLAELAELHASLQKTQDHQAVVYQHALHTHHSAAVEAQTLRQELQTVRAELAQLARKSETYEAAFRTVEQQGGEGGGVGGSSEDALRREVVSLTRRVAEADVSAAKQRRELRLLHDQIKLSEAHAQQLEDEWVEMEHTLKRRIVYLENWKSGAEATLARQDATLEASVPRREAETWRSELHELRGRHAMLGEAYVSLHLRLLPSRNAAAELAALRHEFAMLGGGGDVVVQARVVELEEELKKRVEELQTVETQLHQALALPPASSSLTTGASSPDAEANAVLAERVAELEQMYGSVAREQLKAEQHAQLAAEQAKVLSTKLTQERSKRKEDEERLAELMMATEDHSVVATLQQQLMALRREYQQCVSLLERTREEAQQAARRLQHSELQYDTQVAERREERTAARQLRSMLEEALAQVETRDLMVRSVKFETFKKRLEALEEEFMEEQQKRKALEKELVDGAEVGATPRGGEENRAHVAELRRRVETLETRERLLMSQVETLRNGGGGTAAADGVRRLLQQKEREVAELQRVHSEMVRALEGMKTRNSELLTLVQTAETQRRAAEQARDTLELELQQSQQTRYHRGGGDNQRGEEPSSSSPIMKKKVGLYEQDHVAQQQAAQASIASLKALLAEKNAALEAYKTQLASVRVELAASSAADRRALAAEHKKLFEENQRVIAQLKEATAQLHTLESGSGGEGGRRALAAAEDRHALALKEWKRVEVELAETSARVRELEQEVEVLKGERDLAEARAGEALEEIVTKHEALGELETEKNRVEQQLATAKKEMGVREERMQQLREAVVKLKEEFLKAEDRHAMELAKATSAAVKASDGGAARRRREEEQDREEEKQRLQEQVEMLQEKIKIERKKVEEERTKAEKAMKMEERRKRAAAEDGGGGGGGGGEDITVLRAEVERLKNSLKEKTVGEARVVEELEKKIKVLQAQNLALRESAPAVPSSSMPPASSGAAPPMSSREVWETEKKLQRRVEVLVMRLKEKQAALDASEKQVETLRQRVAESEQKLRDLQRAAASAREAMQGTSTTRTATGTSTSTTTPHSSSSTPGSSVELERQVKFLQESLILKRKEWEESYTNQAERYETQLQRLRSRLALRREDGEGEDRSGVNRRQVSALEREERAFVAAADVADEIEAMAEELRSKDREIVDKDTRMMELELELESLRVEYQRLHRKAGVAGSHPSSSSSTVRQRTSASLKSVSQERQELQDVIENMKKVIERLRSENDKLKRMVEGSGGGGAAPREKLAALQKKFKEVRDNRDVLQAEVDSLRHEVAELKRDKLRLQQRVRQLSVAKSPGKTSEAEQQEREEEHQRLAERLQAKEHELEEMQVLIGKKDAMIHELSSGGGGASSANEEEAERWRSRVDALAKENEQLRHELGAFDEEFFEEIEDLKFKYAQAVRDKQQLEAMLGGQSQRRR